VLPPSGEQFEIAFGEHQAVAVEVGDGLRTYSVGGKDIVDGYGVDEMAGLAVEPMTCPPNALRSGESLITLGPGESHTAVGGLSPTIEVRE
jgi:aldose 1-epimerase